ncbi:MAG TPA: SDR family NAD(P)-dependent oxidoreductase [Myxococcaceae bacterium]|jgi:D-arabinose 1-dehydrogenase-like Zn-dependent alcohol dehydrogenase|nr:SDR family NAD(P)-dependent oxidoreductase [Myxococcaceae bacterium]
MKAMVVRKPGGLEAMRLEDVPDPVPGAREVLIEVEACGVCFHDLLTRNGTLKAGVRMPCVLGHEISGTVVDAGKDVSQFKRGDRVATTQRYYLCGGCRFCRTGRESLCPERKFLGDWGMVGGYAEYVAVSDDNVARVPDGVPLAEASIAGCALGTVLNGIRDVGRVGVGETVLVTGAGGGVGLHAVQLARLAGAFVIAQTTSPQKAALIQEHGAHEVVIHARDVDFSSRVKQLTQLRGVDVVVDNVGTPLFEPTRKSLGVGGRWILIGQLTGDFVPFNPAQLFLKNQSMLAVTSTSRVQLEDVLAMLGRGQIRTVISKSLPLEAAAEAHAMIEAGRAAGRIILRPRG